MLMVERTDFVDSAASVKKAVFELTERVVTEKEVREVLKHDLYMGYRKITKVAIHTNLPRNLILRQQFALKHIELLRKGRVLLAMDETWLGMSDMRKMKWRVKDSTNPVPIMQFLPRISMLVAIDTLGNQYFSLS